MEARLTRAALLAAVLCSLGARYKTPNFVVTASTPQIAEQVGQAAEKYRRELATDWLGKELPKWSEPCPIAVKTGPNLGAGGATSFMFDRGEVYGWRMNIQGSLERVLDSVLPHEVTHTIFASHFRQPLPRWADEGACTTVEHASERQKQEQMLIQFLRTGRGIPFSRMFVMKEYPADVMPLYSQGYSLARFLIGQGGKQKYLEFLGEGLKQEDWVNVTRRHYGFDSLAILQNSWLDWVRQGSPAQSPEAQSEATTTLASSRRARPEPNLIYRAQSEDPPASPLVPVRRQASPAAVPAANRGASLQPQRFEEQPDRLPMPPAWRAPVEEPAAAAAGELAKASQASADAAVDPREMVAASSGAPASGQVLLEWHRPERQPIADASLGRGVLRR